MDSPYLLSAFLLIAGLITWRLLTGSIRERSNESQAVRSLQPMRSSAAQNSDYRAMTLQIGSGPCAAAVASRSQAYLLSEMPRLPLDGCDKRCQCRFKLRDDRRVARNRRHAVADLVHTNQIATASDNRSKRDRRSGHFEYNGIY